ncbi:hypothetical protein DXG03_001443 [Asterophora parasitica]|uniref:MI domain-containing protein n=1 Tax=Asterophora parasitica TaxID=117018 RepID=A0A9P7GE80_9AGAR|nr:hypothetical protein DXG03_001443 [Asterophora parasitica]
MSKSSTATAPKPQLPTKSAWSRGPPQSTSAPSPRSQSPAPSTPVHQTHSRRPSTLGQGVPIKDGVTVPRGNVGALKQSSAVTFGSIDDDSASAPISSSPATAPPIKSEGVKSFGSVPATLGHVNGKPSVSSRSSLAPSASSSSAPSSVPPTPSKPAKGEILKMFQNPSLAPSSSTTSDTSSPSLRPSNLPAQSSSQPQQGQAPPPSQPSQLGSQPYTPFVPGGRPQQQNYGPGGGGPRSPVTSRQIPNGSGPRPQGGPNGGPSQILAGLPPPSSMQPQLQPQLQPTIAVPGWPGYYYQGMPEQHYMPPYGPWYPHTQQQLPPQAQHPHPHHPPPGQHGPPHNGLPMSPRSQPPSLPPGTPTQAHAIPAAHAPPPHSHSHSNSITSPPPTPSSAGAARLNVNSSAFVPGQRSKITFKNAEGLEVDINSIKATSATTSGSPSPGPRTTGFRQGSPSTAAPVATPQRSRPVSVRLETEEQRKQRLANEEEKEKEKAKVKAEAEEKVNKEKERKEKEEADKKRKEEEKEAERVREEEEEKEWIRKEEEAEKERVQKEEDEKERKLKEDTERKVKEEEKEKERVKKEEEEKERVKKEEEKESLRLQAEEAAAKAAADATAPEPTAPEAAPEVAKEEGEVLETTAQDAPIEAAQEKPKEPLSINTGSLLDKKRPLRLDLSGTKSGEIAAPLPSALSTARHIEDLGAVSYPEGIESPAHELNKDAKPGKFRYDRGFLLQFMERCKDKPDNLPPLDAIGLEPNSDISGVHAMTRGGSGRRQGSSSGAPRGQASVGLGFSSGFGKSGGANPFSMGNFGSASKLSSDERFANANRSVSVSGGSMPFGRPSPMQRTASQGGVGGTPMSSNRTRSKRGEKRGEGNKAGGGGGQHGGFHGQSNMAQTVSLEPVVPLAVTANRWDRKTVGQVDPDSPEIVDRKVKGLLNKLTMEKFDSISDQIIAWANKSEKEKDGRTLIQVIRLVFEKATDEATWSEMYARLCRKMMERISPQVQDDGIKAADGKPIAGGQLFRKYLLNRCQEDFERGWVAKEATAAAAATKAAEDQAAKAASEKSKANGEEEVVLYSDEYYAAQKAKRQGLGLVKFIGELFKLQMLTERIMHECVKKQLANVDNPEEEEIESLCKLVTTVGALLDTPKARAHLDVYFSRMKELTKNPNVSSRMQFMLQDVLELRERKWVTRNAVTAPTTIAQIHEAAAKEKAAAEKESYQRQISMSRTGSRRGGDRGDYPQVGPDGWAVAGNGPSRPPPKAGDLSNFGKINKNTAMTFGPSSVFAGKKDNKRESISRTSSSSNMFSMLSQNAEPAAETKAPEPQRKRLVLQPRTKATDEDAPAAKSDSESEEGETAAELTEEQATKKIGEDLKEFYAVRNLDEAEVYFSGLPAAYHSKLIDKLTTRAVESKEADAQLLADLFARVVEKGLSSSAAFDEGLESIAEIIDDIAIDAPKALSHFVKVVKAVSLNDERRTRLASKSLDPEQLLALLS